MEENGEQTALPRFVVEDIVKDRVVRSRIEQAKTALEGAILADIQTFEQRTNLPVSSVSLASETDVDGVQRVTAVAVQVDYSL